MITPNRIERANWRTVAGVAYGRNQCEVANVFAAAGSLDTDSEIAVQHYVKLQEGYRLYLTQDRIPDVWWKMS